MKRRQIIETVFNDLKDSCHNIKIKYVELFADQNTGDSFKNKMPAALLVVSNASRERVDIEDNVYPTFELLIYHTNRRSPEIQILEAAEHVDNLVEDIKKNTRNILVYDDYPIHISKSHITWKIIFIYHDED